MQISLKIIRSINHTKSTVCIKFQLLATFSSLFTASSSLSVFPPSVLYADDIKRRMSRRRKKSTVSWCWYQQTCRWTDRRTDSLIFDPKQVRPWVTLRRPLNLPTRAEFPPFFVWDWKSVKKHFFPSSPSPALAWRDRSSSSKFDGWHRPKKSQRLMDRDDLRWEVDA